MASFNPIYTIIDQALALDLANPNFAISTKEEKIKEAAIFLGCMDYFRSFPMRITLCTTYNSSGGGQSSFNWAGLTPPKKENGAMYIPFEDFFTQGVPQVPQDQIKNAHFLGIMRIERPYWSNYSNPSMWEKQMFGFQVSGTNNFNLLETILSNTLDDLSTGQPRYTINRMQNRVEITAPWGFGQIAIDAAIGFNSPEYAEMSKVDYLCKFISFRFIESIIQARDGIKLDSDFDISTDALKERLNRLQDEVNSIKNHSVLHMAQWS